MILKFGLHRVSTLVFAAFVLAAPVLYAQDFPTKPIRFIVPTSPGGGADTVGRALAQKLTTAFDQQVVVDNRSGGTGRIALELTAAAPPDGYTILFLNGTSTAGSTLHQDRKYDLAKFTPVTQLTEQPFIVLVANNVPVRTPKELIALARAKPGSLAYGSNGTGGMQHLAGILLSQSAGIEMLHVPYKGGAQVLADLSSSQIQVGFTNPLAARSFISAGRLRGIAVTTAKRSKALPDLPAMSEVVPGYQVSNWYGVAAPPAVPNSILRILHKTVTTALKSPDIQDWLEKEGSEVYGSSPEEFGTRITAEVKRWGVVLAKAGISNY
jgi:tripartite-type tricarboxylate transporter receptor subunit TctC